MTISTTKSIYELSTLGPLNNTSFWPWTTKKISVSVRVVENTTSFENEAEIPIQII